MPSIKESIKRSLKHKVSSEKFKSTHDLDFEVGGAYLFSDFIRFKVGTCHGLYSCSPSAYQILAVTNNEKGNGHLGDVFEWFENSCRRDNKDLMILQVWNKGLKGHLIKKRGFSEHGEEDVIKKLK